MPRIYWMQYTPIGVIGIVVLALVALALFNQHQQAERAYSAASSQYNASKTDAPIDSGTLPQQNDPKAYREEWRSEQDLRAQREMAEWAKWMLVATCFGSIVTVIGIVFVAQTLQANRAAVNVAERNIEIAKNTASQQLRAYMSYVEGNAVQEHSHSYTWQLVFQNCGQTPAQNVVIIVDAITQERDAGPVHPDPKCHWQKYGTVGPGLQVTAKLLSVLGEVRHRQIQNKQAAAYIFGFVCYDDVFGVSHFTNFRVKYDRESYASIEKRLLTCHGGNDAN